MAISTVGINRITTTLRTGSMLTSLRRNTLNLFEEQTRISTGKQLLSPSEDPGRSARALNLGEILGQQDQLLTNIRYASNTLDATDGAMSEVSSLIIDAQSIASQNIGALATSAERSASAEVVASIREQLVAVGNRTFEGRYLFAGRKTDQQPFVTAQNGIAYLGDTGDIFTRTAANELNAINLSGDVLFGALSSTIEGTADLTPLLTANTRLENLTGALNQGIRRGTFEIAEEGGPSVTVDITDADTIGDVVDKINVAATDAGAGFVATLNSDGIGITPGGAGITVRDISSGTTAVDLGIMTQPATSAVIVGAALGAAVTRTTRVEDLAAGAGVDLTGGIVLTNGTSSVEVDLSGATTVQDILNTINNAGVFAQARINDKGTGIVIVNKVSGSTLTVGENGGTTASELGFRSFTTETPVAMLNNGQGLRTIAGETDMRIEAKDGSAFEVNLDGALTIDDVLTAINTAATDAGVSVTADLADVGNGVRLTDATGGAGSLAVKRANFSLAIDDLGLNKNAVDPATELVGDDVNGARANGVVTALYDLERALRNDDSQAITIAAEALDEHLTDFNSARGLVGARAANMQDRLEQTQNAVFSTQTLLSEVEDLDYTEAVTKFQQAQTSLQASLLTGSKVLNTSLLDFLR